MPFEFFRVLIEDVKVLIGAVISIRVEAKRALDQAMKVLMEDVGVIVLQAVRVSLGAMGLLQRSQECS
jgi:hypothetical protein